MKKLFLSALGAALVIGAPQVVAEEVQLSQLMIIGQPGQTGNVNRTLPSGSAGVSPLNMPAPGPFSTRAVPSTIQPTPFIGERGDLNFAEPEMAGPAERDAAGRLLPSVDRTQARFTGERGADGKLLPTYAPQEAQARQPAAPGPTELTREQQPSGATTQRRQPSGQAQAGSTGTGQKSQTQRSGSTMSSKDFRAIHDLCPQCAQCRGLHERRQA